MRKVIFPETLSGERPGGAGMINNTLIGADGLMLTLSGRVEIRCALTCLPGRNEASERTVIEAYPGIGVPVQRVALDGRRILDVETLQPIDYNNYPFRGPGGKA